MCIHGFQNAVGSEDEDVFGLESESDGFIFDIRKHTERSAIDFDFLNLSSANENRTRGAGVGNHQLAQACVVDREQQGNVTGRHVRGIEAAIQYGEHFLWPAAMILGVFAENAHSERTIKRCGGSFAGNISQRQAEAAAAVGEKIVEVSGQLTRRDIGGCNVQAGNVTFAVGQKLALDFARGVQIVLQALLAIAGLFEKAGIFERDGDIGAEDSQHAFVLGGEGVEVCAFEIENADESILK